MRPHVFERHADLAANPKNQAVLDGWAKEDARYAVSLATEGQVGLTLNARNLELMLRRLAAARRAELRDLNGKLHELAGEIAPSIILFTEATEFDSPHLRGGCGRRANAGRRGGGKGAAGRRAAKPKMPEANRARRAPAPAAWRSGWPISRRTVTGRSSPPCCIRRPPIRMISACAGSGGTALPEKQSLIEAALRRMEFYDLPLREFEYAGLTFAADVSASASPSSSATGWRR